MEYQKISLVLSPTEPFNDMLTFQLGEIGYEMFEETENGLHAFIRKEHFLEAQLNELLDSARSLGCEVQASVTLIPWQNWNAEWESNFQPEIIAGRIYIRAEFHEEANQYPHQIVIQPKMAFGTGHHPTTAQVMALMLEYDFKGKSIIDMGCGTGILAILAKQLGAGEMLAIDYDPIAVENTIENFERNGVTGYRTQIGEAQHVHGETCDVLLANINRNIILQDIEHYRKWMNAGAILFTSGYYENDLPVIREAAEKAGLTYSKHTTSQDWCCAIFTINQPSTRS